MIAINALAVNPNNGIQVRLCGWLNDKAVVMLINPICFTEMHVHKIQIDFDIHKIINLSEHRQ